MVNYTYVRLSSDIYSGSDITRSGSDIQYLLIQYPFGYFATSVRISVRVFRIGFGCHFGYRVKCPPLVYYMELLPHGMKAERAIHLRIDGDN